MENKELQELITEEEDSLLEDFSLDDIMKEFGAEEDAAEAASDSEAEASPLSDTRELPDLSQVEAVVERQEETAQEEAVPEAEAEEEPAPVTEETVRIPDVPSDTIRMEPVALPKGKVTNAQPVDDEADAKEEPYSSKWEPEYEQPIGEYVPPQPIQFQPRSKIRELKRFVLEYGKAQGWKPAWAKADPNGHKVAVIGAGPSGLSCAAQLCKAGYEVTVFEKEATAGGSLRYALPDYTYNKQLLDEEVDEKEKYRLFNELRNRVEQR